MKILGLSRNRQKAGDCKYLTRKFWVRNSHKFVMTAIILDFLVAETIQKMIANLPPKRITRRIIQFDDIESKNPNRVNVSTCHNGFF